MSEAIVPTAEVARVVILGAGYGGVLAANRVAGRLGKRAQVTLVSARDELIHRVRLHEVLAGRRFQRYPLASLVRRRVARVIAQVERIDAAAQRVYVRDADGERALAYDHLIVALGSRLRAAVPGTNAHAAGLADLERARDAATTLRGLHDGAPVIVVGGGLTGVEAATEIAEAYPRLRVTIIARAIVPSLSDDARRYTCSVLDELGVTVRAGTVDEITADAVIVDGMRVPAALTIWAGGFESAGPAVPSDLPVDERGGFVVDANLAVIGAPNVFAIGDAAAPPPGLPFVRMACATAMPMGAHAADNVARAVRGRALQPLRFGYFGACVSLGRRRGVIQSTDRCDRPIGHVYTGRTGALIKETICRFVIGALRLERRVAGAYRWSQATPALVDGSVAAPLALPPGA